MNKSHLLRMLVAADVLLAFASVGAEGFFGWTLPSPLAEYARNRFSGFSFSSPGACPRPSGWSSNSPAVACAERPSAWELADAFVVGKSPTSLQGRCSTSTARVRLVAMLHALNSGGAGGVAAAFTTDGRFQPYNASVRSPFRGRAAIKGFAAKRIAAVDGWTASELDPPAGGPQTPAAAYTVTLVAYTNGRPDGAGVARMVVDCRSGLIREWAGPALPLPA